MNVIILSSHGRHRAYSGRVQDWLTREGNVVWVDWPTHVEKYAEQMLSLIDNAQLAIIFLDTEFLANSSNTTIWNAALLSRTPKLVLVLDDVAVPVVNDTFTVHPNPNLDTLHTLVLDYVQKQLRLTLFISYSRRDTTHVDALLRLISRSLGQVWIDKSGLKPGEQFPDAILRGIETNDWFVLVWSRHSARSPWVYKEWNHALGLHKKMVPILLDSTPLPEALGKTQAFTSLYDESLYDFLSIPDAKRAKRPTGVFALWQRVRAIIDLSG